MRERPACVAWNICDVDGAHDRLAAMGHAVNDFWKECTRINKEIQRAEKRFVDGNEMCKLTAGSSKRYGLHSETLQCVCHAHFKTRRKWRTSDVDRAPDSPLTTLWIPFGRTAIRRAGCGLVTFMGHEYIAEYVMRHENHPSLDVLRGRFGRMESGAWGVRMYVPAKGYYNE